MNRILLLCLFFSAFVFSALAQRTVSGTITDDNGEPLPGVNVVIKGTTTGATTDLDGNFRLSVGDNATLVFSYVGFETQEIEVGARTVLDLSMSGITELQEVVVTALGAERDKRSVGYSIQNVDGDDVEGSRETHLVNALQGQVAGVQIQGTQSSLGGSSRITIRGANSFLGNNQPLFVVDGVPVGNSNYSSSSQQRGFGEGAIPYDYGNAISDINPADIENISVLKGAAASALYGVRGANGVIVITTKKGKKKKGLGVSVNSALTFDKVQNLIPHQQVYGGGAVKDTESEFIEFIENGISYLAPEYAKDGAWGPKYDPNVMVRHWDSWDPDSPNYGETRPWTAPANGYEEFFDVGQTWTNSFALEGGTEQSQFRLSYTNVDQSGTTPNGSLARNTFSLNASLNPVEKLLVTASANFVDQSVEGRNVTGYNNANAMQAFNQWWQTNLDVARLERTQNFADGTPYTWNLDGPIIDENTGELLDFQRTATFFDNPYWVRNNYLQEDVKNRLFGNVDITYDLFDFLSVNAKLMRDGFTWQMYEGVPQQSVEASLYSETTRTFEETNYQFQFLFDKQFGDFSVNASFGGNQMNQSLTYSKLSTSGGLSIPDFFHLSNSVQPIVYDVDPSRQNVREEAIHSLFGVASVGYKNMLFLDATFRNDWASTLPDDQNPFFYPSVSTSFVFSELPVFSGSILSFGKLRLAYGKAANAPAPYSLGTTYQPMTPNWGNAARFTVPNAKNNPDLRPEETTEFEIGTNVSFLDNRVTLDLAYYSRETVDQIVPVDVSPTTGFTSVFVNAGVMTNKGVEITLSGTPIKISGFQWDVSVNFAKIENEVVSLKEGVQSIGRGGTWAAELRIQEGFPYMGVWGEDFVRTNQVFDEEGALISNTGDIIVDADGRPERTGDRIYLGSAIPDFTGGVRNTFGYKGINLGVLIDFQKGGIIHSTSLQWAKYSGMMEETVFQNGVDIRESGYLVEGVTSDGQPNTVRMQAQDYFQNYFRVATPNIYDASFVKLREINLSYQLPNSVISDTPFNSVSFGVFGRNLAIISADIPHLDPQVITGSGNDQGLENAQVPPTRSLGFNLGFTF